MLYCVASAIAQRAGKLAWRREGIPFISGPSGIEGDDYQRNPEAELHTVFFVRVTRLPVSMARITEIIVNLRQKKRYPSSYLLDDCRYTRGVVTTDGGSMNLTRRRHHHPTR